MIPEVLVVDDSRSAARGYADLIRLKANVPAVYATSSAEALAKIKEYPIKVLVLDQKMPKTTGTTLFQELHEINPLAKAIMLTGEADADEIGEALRIGYSSYIHKSRVAELPGQVLTELLKYHTDFRSNQTPEKMATVSSGFFRRTIIDIYYISSIVLDERYVDPKSWITAAEVKAGETIKIKDKIEFESRLRIDTSIESKISSGFHGKILGSGLGAKLESYLTAKLAVTNEIKQRASQEVERDYSLAKEPEKPDANFVVSRAYQRAPVYRKIESFLELKCSACERDECVSVVALQPTRFIANRQVDVLLRGGSRIIEGEILQY